MSGPLAGVRVIEFAGQGPAPFGCMLLADLGADVIRIDRTGASEVSVGAHGRGRRSIALDLKSSAGKRVALELVATADVLVEGFRPGVMERLGLGPDDCTGVNARLIYARMTGWGQCGPLAQRAGHDINYIAEAGALDQFGTSGQPPIVPLNLVGDYGAGGPFLAMGILAALWERTTSALGQTIDVAMVDGVAAMLAPFHASHDGGQPTGRGSNLLGGSAPCYGTYETLDGRFLSVGALERPFYLNLLGVLEIDPAALGGQFDREAWPAARERIATAFAERSRDEWLERFDDVDACVSPVLTLEEARRSTHARARDAYLSSPEGLQVAAAPRFSRTPATPDTRLAPIGADTEAIMAEIGIDAARRTALISGGVVA